MPVLLKGARFMVEREEYNEKLLVRELIDNNEKAFRKLFDTYRRDIYAYSKSILKSSQYAEEIVQEVFLKVWLNRANLNPELSFKSFVFTVARNLSFNVLSKAANERNMWEEIFYESQKFYNPTEDQVRQADYEILKKNAINQLPSKRKLIFEMSRNEGKSYEEISQELGISISTVKGQMNKALKTIRSFLRAHGHLTILMILLSSGWFDH